MLGVDCLDVADVATRAELSDRLRRIGSFRGHVDAWQSGDAWSDPDCCEADPDDLELLAEADDEDLELSEEADPDDLDFSPEAARRGGVRLGSETVQFGYTSRRGVRRGRIS